MQLPRDTLASFWAPSRQLLAWSGCEMLPLPDASDEQCETSPLLDELARSSSRDRLVMLCCRGPDLAEREEIHQLVSTDQVRQETSIDTGTTVKRNRRYQELFVVSLMKRIHIFHYRYCDHRL